MSWQDIVNAGYESIGGLMIFLHCLTLYRDKEVKGVSTFATVVFTSWGYWNLYYYPHLNQWASFAGGVVIVLANTLWIAMMYYYLRVYKAPYKPIFDEFDRMPQIEGETFGEYIERTEKARSDEYARRYAK